MSVVGPRTGAALPSIIDIPASWQRRGAVFRGSDSPWGAQVLGDPCIVRDEEAGVWRMFLFALPPGHAHAVCAGDPLDPSAWRLAGPLEFTNAEILGGALVFKPFVILNPHVPGRAAHIGGRYALLFGTDHEAKVVRRAWSRSLCGPWTIEPGVLLARGSGDDFDAKHVDAVSAYAFEERGEILYCYMGYPLRAQPHALSPFGSSQGAAIESLADAIACGDAVESASRETPRAVRKLGCVLRPSTRVGHWASGWVGGLQLWRGRSHRWLALVNASPTAPRQDDTSLAHEEPPPSLGGFAFSDQEFPCGGWSWCDEPIERMEDIPQSAVDAGERLNLWRHHALVLDDGTVGLFYNAGNYFEEKLFLRTAKETMR